MFLFPVEVLSIQVIWEEIGTIASQISKKVEFIPRLRSGELSSIFASEVWDYLNADLTEGSPRWSFRPLVLFKIIYMGGLCE